MRGPRRCITASRCWTRNLKARSAAPCARRDSAAVVHGASIGMAGRERRPLPTRSGVPPPADKDVPALSCLGGGEEPSPFPKRPDGPGRFFQHGDCCKTAKAKEIPRPHSSTAQADR